MDNFKELDIYELEQIDGGMSKKDIKGIAGTAAYIGGAVAFCANPGLGLILLGTALTTWDTMN